MLTVTLLNLDINIMPYCRIKEKIHPFFIFGQTTTGFISDKEASFNIFAIAGGIEKKPLS
jgi:hypothetical protein